LSIKSLCVFVRRGLTLAQCEHIPRAQRILVCPGSELKCAVS